MCISISLIISHFSPPSLQMNSTSNVKGIYANMNKSKFNPSPDYYSLNKELVFS